MFDGDMSDAAHHAAVCRILALPRNLLWGIGNDKHPVLRGAIAAKIYGRMGY